MHNLHLIRVESDTAEEACNAVESYISGWGDENNWYTICGCIGEDNEVYENSKDGRWTAEEYGSIKALNKEVNGWIGDDDLEKNAKKSLKKPNAKKNSMDWYNIEKWAKEMGERVNLPKKLDVLSDTYYDHEFNECGITEIYDNETGEGKDYVVLVDMHS